MPSGNRVALSPSDVRDVLTAAGLDPDRLDSYEELAEGTFNSAYRLRMAEGDLVLKVAPDPAAPVMGYERGLMRTEELFYRTAHGRVPVPEVVHTDYGRTVVGGERRAHTAQPRKAVRPTIRRSHLNDERFPRIQGGWNARSAL